MNVNHSYAHPDIEAGAIEKTGKESIVVKKPSGTPQWFDFGESSEFEADGSTYGRVEIYKTGEDPGTTKLWIGKFLNGFAGYGKTMQQAKRSVESAYDKWLAKRR